MKRKKINGGRTYAKDLVSGQKVYFGDSLDAYIADKVDIEKYPYGIHVVTFKDSDEIKFTHDVVYTDRDVFINDTIKDAEEKEKEEEIRWNNETIAHDSYVASLHLRIKKFKDALLEK